MTLPIQTSVLQASNLAVQSDVVAPTTSPGLDPTKSTLSSAGPEEKLCLDNIKEGLIAVWNALCKCLGLECLMCSIAIDVPVADDLAPDSPHQESPPPNLNQESPLLPPPSVEYASSPLPQAPEVVMTKVKKEPSEEASKARAFQALDKPLNGTTVLMDLVLEYLEPFTLEEEVLYYPERVVRWAGLESQEAPQGLDRYRVMDFTGSSYVQRVTTSANDVKLRAFIVSCKNINSLILHDLGWMTNPARDGLQERVQWSNSHRTATLNLEAIVNCFGEKLQRIDLSKCIGPALDETPFVYDETVRRSTRELILSVGHEQLNHHGNNTFESLERLILNFQGSRDISTPFRAHFLATWFRLIAERCPRLSHLELRNLTFVKSHQDPNVDAPSPVTPEETIALVQEVWLFVCKERGKQNLPPMHLPFENIVFS